MVSIFARIININWYLRGTLSSLLIKGFDYSRAGNPTREDVEKNIAAVENAKFCVQFLLDLFLSWMLFLIDMCVYVCMCV